MNVRMWEHPATQANLRLLVERGVHVLGPESGDLAEGEHGPGRMAEPQDVFARCLELLGADGPLRGRSVLVSAGRDAGAARLGALRRQPLLREDGRRGRAGGAQARGGVTLVASLPRGALSRRDRRRAGAVRRRPGPRGARPRRRRRRRDGRRGGRLPPGRTDRREAPEGFRDCGRSTSSRPRMCSPSSGGGGGTARSSWVRRDEGEAGLVRARAKLTNKRGNLFVYNDVSRSLTSGSSRTGTSWSAHA